MADVPKRANCSCSRRGLHCSYGKTQADFFGLLPQTHPTVSQNGLEPSSPNIVKPCTRQTLSPEPRRALQTNIKAKILRMTELWRLQRCRKTAAWSGPPQAYWVLLCCAMSHDATDVPSRGFRAEGRIKGSTTHQPTCSLELSRVEFSCSPRQACAFAPRFAKAPRPQILKTQNPIAQAMLSHCFRFLCATTGRSHSRQPEESGL